MNLVHYSPWPLSLELIKRRGQHHEHGLTFKPRGLWLSDNDEEENWPVWCMNENFRLEQLRWAYRVRLKPTANIYRIQTKDELAAFDRHFGYDPPNWPQGMNSRFHINWGPLADWYDGILITPYIYSMRFDLLWYYAWDVASGCIWNPDCIEALEPYWMTALPSPDPPLPVVNPYKC